MEYIDAHCHLNAAEFVDDLDDVITRAKQCGVRACVVVTEFVSDFERTLGLAELYSGFIHPCLGLHPIQEGSRCVTADDFEQALPLIEKHKDRIVAIGEVFEYS